MECEEDITAFATSQRKAYLLELLPAAPDADLTNRKVQHPRVITEGANTSTIRGVDCPGRHALGLSGPKSRPRGQSQGGGHDVTRYFDHERNGRYAEGGPTAGVMQVPQTVESPPAGTALLH